MGTGKSPAFFFYSDNRLLMLKTMKQTEFDILFDDGKFLLDYFRHVQ